MVVVEACRKQKKQLSDRTGLDESEGETDDEDSDDEAEAITSGDEDTVKFDDIDEHARLAPHLTTQAEPVQYQLVIPTFGRWRPVQAMSGKRKFAGNDTPFILAHTLRFLSRQQIPKSRVTLFVANEDELSHYKQALHGSDWATVRIRISELGNAASRNRIMRSFPKNTYIVSVDDDVERIVWKIREGMTHHCLRSIPPGAFEKLIFDAYKKMRANKAFLWGLSTSQNARHMRTYGMSVRCGLVNGYLNGFINRPNCPELFRTLADATEDSEFSARHFAKDGVILRYRMYAGITSPYLNRGGLQSKFEVAGEVITAAQRSCERKQEERRGAAALHDLFPKLIGPPKQRRDKKTMEVNFLGPCLSNKKRIAPQLLEQDKIRYQQRNPKVPGCQAFHLYEGYKRARTVAGAARLGARPIDFAHDYNWGFLRVVGLASAKWDVEVETGVMLGPQRTPKSHKQFVKVRIREMSLGHLGLDVPKSDIERLKCRCPALCFVDDKQWAAEDGPLASVRLVALRSILRFVETGLLRYERKHAWLVYDALKVCGRVDMARKVKSLEALPAAAKTSTSVQKHLRAPCTSSPAKLPKKTNDKNGANNPYKLRGRKSGKSASLKLALRGRKPIRSYNAQLCTSGTHIPK